MICPVADEVHAPGCLLFCDGRSVLHAPSFLKFMARKTARIPLNPQTGQKFGMCMAGGASFLISGVMAGWTGRGSTACRLLATLATLAGRPLQLRPSCFRMI